MPSNNAAMYPPNKMKDTGESCGIRDYRSGARIDLPECRQTENMAMLAEGRIKVRVVRSAGESTIQILNPGDLVDISVINRSDVPQTRTRMYALGETTVLSMGREKIEYLIESQSEMMCHVIRGTVRGGREILHSMNHQFRELRNYLYGVNGLY